MIKILDTHIFATTTSNSVPLDLVIWIKKDSTKFSVYLKVQNHHYASGQ